MERHTHNMWHEHNRGTMEIWGRVDAYYRAGGSPQGAFYIDNNGSHRNPGYSDVGGCVGFQASNNWSGQTSGPLDTSGNAIYDTGTNTGRTWDTTHGKQIGVRYLIKAL